MLSSRLLLVKYALKSGALRRMPEFYWCMRRLLKGLDDPARAAALPRGPQDRREFRDVVGGDVAYFSEVHAFEPIPRFAPVP